MCVISNVIVLETQQHQIAAAITKPLDVQTHKRILATCLVSPRNYVFSHICNIVGTLCL